MLACRLRWLPLIVLVACYRHDPALLREAQLQRAQTSSIDCGEARPREPAPQALHDCMVSAFLQRQPFHVRFWKQGIDSTIAEGVASDANGKLYVYRFDSSPCGAPGRCRPRIEETLCVQPYIRDGAQGKQLACASPPFNTPSPSDATSRTAVAPPQAADPAIPVRVGGDVKPPRAIHRVEPQYEACRDKEMTIRGAPLLEATIDVDGTVRDVRMIKSVHPCLDNSIVEALKQWRFEPGTRNGKPVPVLYSMTVHIHVR